jgi:hypothetical protein
MLFLRVLAEKTLLVSPTGIETGIFRRSLILKISKKKKILRASFSFFSSEPFRPFKGQYSHQHLKRQVGGWAFNGK